MAKGLSAAKAKKILTDGYVKGKPLTAKQKKYFGAIASGATPLKAIDGADIEKAQLGKILKWAKEMYQGADKATDAVNKSKQIERYLPKGANSFSEVMRTPINKLPYFKLNPNSFKPDPTKFYYRGIGKTGIDDAINSGVVRPPIGSQFGDDLFMSANVNVADMYASNFNSVFSKNFRKSDGDPTKYIAEIPITSLTNPNSRQAIKRMNELDTAHHEYVEPNSIPSSEVNFYKENWLKGYKKFNFQNGGWLDKYESGGEVPKAQVGLANKLYKLFKGAKKFDSSIDWRKWVKYTDDFDNNPDVIKHLNEIEETTKANGTWMTNPDGSAFKGTQEEFVIQQSDNFKKAFGESKLLNPDGSPIVLYHGSPKKFDTFDESMFQLGDSGYSGSGIYTTPSKVTAESYTISGRRFHDGEIEPTLYELYGRGNNPITSKQLIDNSGGDIGFGKVGEPMDTSLPTSLFNFHRKGAPTIDQLLKYDVSVLNQRRGVSNVKPIQDAWEIVFPTNKQLKSRKGNILFDMTNPNIYKAIVPGAIGAGAVSQMGPKQQDGQFKNGGWLDKYQMGGSLPGASGMMYGRTSGNTPMEPGKLKKAQTGINDIKPVVDQSIIPGFEKFLFNTKDDGGVNQIKTKNLQTQFDQFNIAAGGSCVAGSLNCNTGYITPNLPDLTPVRTLIEDREKENPNLLEQYKIKDRANTANPFIPNNSIDAWEIHQLLRGEGLGTAFFTASDNTEWNGQLPKGLDLTTIPLGAIIGQGASEGTYTKSEDNEEGQPKRNRHGLTVVGYDFDGMPMVYDSGSLQRLDFLDSLVDEKHKVTRITVPKGYEKYTYKYMNDQNTKKIKDLGYKESSTTLRGDVSLNSDWEPIQQIEEAANYYSPTIALDYGVPKDTMEMFVKLLPGLSAKETKLNNKDGFSAEVAASDNAIVDALKFIPKIGGKLIDQQLRPLRTISNILSGTSDNTFKNLTQTEIDAYKEFNGDMSKVREVVNSQREINDSLPKTSIDLDELSQTFDSSVGAFRIKDFPEYVTDRFGIKKSDLFGTSVTAEQEFKKGTAAALSYLAEKYQQAKDLYKDKNLTEEQLVDLSIVGYNNQTNFKNPEFVDYYIKNKDLKNNYLERVKEYNYTDERIIDGKEYPDWESFRKAKIEKEKGVNKQNRIAKLQSVPKSKNGISLTGGWLDKYEGGNLSKAQNGIKEAINKYLGDPYEEARQFAENPDELANIDNMRHAQATRLVQEAIANKTGNIPLISDALGFLGSNALGVGHELSTLLGDKDKRDLSTKLQESGEDIFNNLFGSVVGALPIDDKMKDDVIKYVSYNNMLPDGYVREEQGEENGFSENVYFKNEDGDIKRPEYKNGGSVSWQWKGNTYSGTLIPSMENEKNRYARTKNGKVKTLPKSQMGTNLPFGIKGQGFSNVQVPNINWAEGIPELKGTENRQGVNVSGFNLSKRIKLLNDLDLNLSNPALVYARPTLDNMTVGNVGKVTVPFQPTVGLTYKFKEGGAVPKAQYGKFLKWMKKLSKSDDALKIGDDIVEQYVKRFDDRTFPSRGGKIFDDGISEFNSLQSMYNINPKRVVRPFGLITDEHGVVGYGMENLKKWQELSDWRKRNTVPQSMKDEMVSTVRDFNSQGIYHGDLKPNNIMVDEAGNWKIIDPVGFKHADNMTPEMIDAAKKFDIQATKDIQGYKHGGALPKAQNGNFGGVNTNIKTTSGESAYDDVVQPGDPNYDAKYKDAYNAGAFASMPNQLDEVVINSGVDYEKYPYYNDLSEQDREYFKDEGAIGRGVRRRAQTKKGLAEDTYDVVNPLMYGMMGVAGGMMAGPALSTLGRGAAPYVSRYALNPIQRALNYKPMGGPASIGNMVDLGFADMAIRDTPGMYDAFKENPNWDTGTDLALTASDIIPYSEIFTGFKGTKKFINSATNKFNDLTSLKPNFTPFENNAGKAGIRNLFNFPINDFANPLSGIRSVMGEGLERYKTQGNLKQNPFWKGFSEDPVSSAAEFNKSWTSAPGFDERYNNFMYSPQDPGLIEQRSGIQNLYNYSLANLKRKQPGLFTNTSTTINMFNDPRVAGSILDDELDTPLKEVSKMFPRLKTDADLLSSLKTQKARLNNTLRSAADAASNLEQIKKTGRFTEVFDTSNLSPEDLKYFEENKDVLGFFTSGDNRAIVNRDQALKHYGSNPEKLNARIRSIIGHEDSHVVDVGGRATKPIYDETISQAIPQILDDGKNVRMGITNKKIDEIWPTFKNLSGERQKMISYLSEPTEVAARIKELRMQFIPKEFIGTDKQYEMSDDLINKIISEGKKGNTSVDSSFFRLIKDKDAFKNLFKVLPAAAPIVLGAASQKKSGGVIEDDRGQWAYPGEVTKINSNNITMKGVNYPVLGISDTGDTQMMYPNREYQYEGNSVTEYPMAQNGDKVVKDFMSNYINSPKFKERLASSNYNDVEGQVTKRSNNIDNTNYIEQEETPDLLETFNKMYKDEPYSTSGSKYDERLNTLIYDKKQDIDYGIGKNSVIAHEYGHAALDGTPGLGDVPSSPDKRFLLNDYDSNELTSRLRKYKGQTQHDLNPTENKSDLDAFRFELSQQGVYDAGKEDITKDILKKGKDSFIKKRLLKNYKEKDLIWLMNNIASIDNSRSDLSMMAKNGSSLVELNQLTNFTNYNNPQPGGWLDKYN